MMTRAMQTLTTRTFLAVALVALSAAGVQAGEPVITDASAAGPRTRVAPRDAEEPAGFLPDIGIGARFRWLINDDPSRYAFFTDDTTFSAGLFADVEVLRHALSDERLRVGLEWFGADATAVPLFGQDTALEEHHVLATAELVYDLASFLAPYARLAAGVAFYDLSVGDLSAAEDWLLSTYGVLGLEAVARWSIDFGARLEYGYAMRVSPSFTLSRGHVTPADQDEMPLEGTSMGALSVDGQLVTFSLFARF